MRFIGSLSCSVLMVSATVLSANVSAGGLVGGFVEDVGKATGVKPLEDLGRNADEENRRLKEKNKLYKKIDEGVSRPVRETGKAAADTVQTFENAAGDTFKTIQKAGSDTVTTLVKAGNDATATYVKAWKDTGKQAKRSFEDAVEAGQAVKNYIKNQAKAQQEAVKNAGKRLRDGKVIDAMWGLAVEPAQATEKNFARATQESAIINAAAQSAAATYGGPAGAAAYAAWSTYRATGDANLAMRAGIISALTSQGGSSVASLPSGTAGEVVKKAAIAGAAGGIAVAAAGGDEKAIKDGFLKSSGAVLIQSGTNKLNAYSPKAKNAFEAVQCISAKDVDCLSNSTYARDVKGKILYDSDGNPRIASAGLDPKKYIGAWTEVNPKSAEGKLVRNITQISKLPKSETIPLLGNQWVLTWILGQDKVLNHNRPAVVLTSAGDSQPFISTAKYGIASTNTQEARPKSTGDSRVASNSLSYSCPFNGFNRTVKASENGNGCNAIYRKEDGVAQVIWRSDSQQEICAAKAATFVARLERLGIRCASS